MKKIGTKIVRLALLIILVLSLFGCESLQVNDEKKKNMVEQGLPIAILKYYTSNPNSVGGVDANVIWQNISDKQIKYIYFTFTPYNRVNDVVYCEIRNTSGFQGRGTGPFEIKGVYGRNSSWVNAWYNSTINHMAIVHLKVTFMDGKEQSFYKDEINKMIVKNH